MIGKLLDKLLWRVMGEQYRIRVVSTALEIGAALNEHGEPANPEAAALLAKIRSNPESASLKQLTRLFELIRPLKGIEDDDGTALD